MSLRILSEHRPPVDLSDWTKGFIDVSVEVGDPEGRSVAFDRPDGDGNDDHTRFVGARAVTLGITLLEYPHHRQELIDLLAPLMHPRNRLTIEYAAIKGRAPRWIRVRPEASPITWDNASKVELAWSFITVGPPWWLGTERVVDLAPSGDTDGIGFDWEFDLEFPDVPSTVAQATNAGTEDSHWTWTIVGPVRRPALRNDATGETISLAGLDLLAGQSAVVDSATRTVTVDGQHRWGAVDEFATDWWLIPAGQSVPVTMQVASATAPGAGTLHYFDSFYA